MRLALFLAFALLSMSANSQTSKKLAIIGSSTSACYALVSNDSCYVSLLEHHYETVNPQDTTIERLAQVGTNVYNGMPSSYVSPYGAGFEPLAGKNITAAVALSPNVIIVNYPTNAYDALSVTEVMVCLRTIRDSANIKGIPCFVTTSQPRTSPASFNTPAIKRKLAEIKDSVLAEFGSFALDFWTGLINPADTTIRYNSGDDIHMNGLGHAELYQRVLAKNIFLATLPASFVNFNSIYKNNAGIINWVTTRETDVAYFEIQKSSDGKNFSKIGTVHPVTPNAGSSIYQYVDAQANAGISFYKIVIVDRDGRRQASPAMRIQGGTGKFALSKVYAPNATTVAIEVMNNEGQQIEVQIVNQLGVLVANARRRVEAGTTTFYLSSTPLTNGVYHLKLMKASGESISTSFIKK